MRPQFFSSLSGLLTQVWLYNASQQNALEMDYSLLSYFYKQSMHHLCLLSIFRHLLAHAVSNTERLLWVDLNKESNLIRNIISLSRVLCN